MARKRALRRRLVVIILVVCSLALLTVYFRESSGGPLHSVQARSLQAVAPLQGGAARVIQPFRNAWNWAGGLFSAHSENRRLKAEVQQLRSQVADTVATQQQNDEMKALLKLKRETVFPKGVTLIAARVIARSPTAWYSTVTLDAGSSQGVSVGDAVVNGDGLVGRVSSVTSGASNVTLVTDQESYVDSVTLPGGAQGLLSGSVTGDLALQYVDRGEKVEKGQVVETSGRMQSIFVRGIPIGVVSAVGQQEVELYQSIAVTPYVDFHTLDLVMVVTQP